MSQIRRRAFLWILTSRPVRFAMKWILPAIRFGKKDIPQHVYEKINELVKPGMTILVRDPLKFSHILIGGEWSHAGICVEQNYGTKVIGEMGHSDYQELNLRKFLGYSQRVAIIKPRCSTNAYMRDMSVHAQFLGFNATEYDNVFELGEESLYCSELIYLADKRKEYEASLEDIAFLGHEYISPDGLYKGKNTEVVYEWNR